MHVQTEQFEGPLDALLEMIEGQKLDITEVSLAKIADQYVDFVQSQPTLDVEEAALFLVIAARLLLIKSKVLLPYLVSDEEEEEIRDFERQLKIYKDFVDVAVMLEGRWNEQQVLHVRDGLRLVTDADRTFCPPPHVTADVLQKAVGEAIDRLRPQERLREDIITRSVSLEERISHIRQRLQHFDKFHFSALLEKGANKIDVIVNFLAVLELAKQRTVTARQQQLFDDIIITKMAS